MLQVRNVFCLLDILCYWSSSGCIHVSQCIWYTGSN